MKISSWLVSLVILAVCATPALADEAPPTPGSPAAVEPTPPVKSPLQGSIQHSEAVAPLPLEYAPGAKLDEQSLPKLTPENRWYPIPNWIAGTWQYKTETVTYLRAFDKKKYPQTPFTLHNEFQRTYGYQKDRTGQIWDYLKAPYRYQAKLDGGLIGYVTDGTVDISKATNEEVVRKVFGNGAVVDPESQQIVLTNQKECFTRYTPFSDDAIRLEGSTKVFAMDGSPQVLKFSDMLGMRVKPFEVVDQLDGQNLRQMFGDFLRANGKADLAP
jgi:hypothetical protein